MGEGSGGQLQGKHHDHVATHYCRSSPLSRSSIASVTARLADLACEGHTLPRGRTSQLAERRLFLVLSVACIRHEPRGQSRDEPLSSIFGKLKEAWHHAIF